MSLPKVLIVGVYLTDHESRIKEIISNLNQSLCYEVVHRWVACGKTSVPAQLEPYTFFHQKSPAGKFVLLNQLLKDYSLPGYEYVLVCDDDIDLPNGFLDRYLRLVKKYELALAQPARTPDSELHHFIVRQLKGLTARRTRFVEIGPLFSIRQDVLPYLLPFDESNPMGWGFDFVWPIILEKAGFNMGIVDATPVQHTLRATAACYDDGLSRKIMSDYLASKVHLSRDEAAHIIESFAEGE